MQIQYNIVFLRQKSITAYYPTSEISKKSSQYKVKPKIKNLFIIMKKTSPYLLCLMLLLSAPSWARKVSQDEAQQIAQRFLSVQLRKNAKASLLAIPQQLNIRKSARAGYAPYYIYNADKGKGFVIVSGDDAVAEILAYSTESSFDLENAPDNIVSWMQLYADAIENASATKSPSCQSAPETGTPVVEPLLGNIEWGQDAPFNGKCPVYKDAGGKEANYYVGCVATAMAQIMKFYEYPAKGTGTRTYESNVGKLTADFGATTYDWGKMLPRLEKDNADAAQNDAVATLCYQLGVSVHMSYAPSGSGAYSQMVTGALVKYFGYDEGMSYKVRDYYSTPEWMQMIKNELDARRPVYYSASNEDGMGGHAFVCDGYDTNDFVHINWGWYGKSNGYFMVNAMNPYELGIGANGGGYNLGQEIIVGIKPAAATAETKEWPVYGSTRLAVYPYETTTGTKYGYMAFIENDDTENFEGKVAAVLEKDGDIVKVLKEEVLNIKGVDPTIKGLIDAVQLSMKDIPGKMENVPDGQYRTRLAIKAKDADAYTILRHPNCLPAYADATVTNGEMKAEIHTPEPDVTLLEKITTDGDLYAKGSGAFHLNLQNNSNDFYVNNILLKFTSVDNPSQSYVVGGDKKATNRVYDNSSKEITIIANLPVDMQPGMYEVTAFEEKHEAHPFKDDAVGKAVLEVKEEATSPIIRQTNQLVWIGAQSYNHDVKQGEKALVTQDVRNYGTAGDAGLLMKLEDVEDASKSYPFLLTNETFKQGELRNVKYYSRLDVDPGQYKIKTYYVTDNGEKPVEGRFEDCVMEVQENPDLVLECESFTLPTEMQKGVKIPFSVTLKALKDVKRKFYIRLRQMTGRGGEAVHIEFNLNMKAGETKTLEKSYKPTVKAGRYIIMMETQKDQSAFETVGKYINFGKIYTVSETTGIHESETANEQVQVVFSDNGKEATLLRENDALRIVRVEVFSLSGAKVLSSVPTSNVVALPLAGGVYLLQVVTDNGTIAKKFVVR